LQIELSGYARQVTDIINEIRSAIEKNTNGPLNIDGCLIGVVDDYLDSFDGQNQKLLPMFEKNN